ncbi:diguanylate cyclase domain-containing protein [Methylophaga sp.]|uniref:diguanylate cyclase domain-containing protein n=1 Tax=Methylophaga sp. TaxID=2024840 RepID=UPI00272665BE|nr:diguanylate cyclase [Methylophaga sp.]MDO8825024.1 diguanylate cyclase [Methylophaga sp.]
MRTLRTRYTDNNSIWQILPKQRGDQLDYENLKKLCDEFPLGIVLCDEKRRCLYSNQAYDLILGYTDGEIIDTDWRKCIYAEDVSSLDISWKNAVLNHTALQNDIRLIRNDGSMVWTRLHVSLLEDGQYPFASLLMIEDISQRKALELVLQKVENALFEEKERAQVTLDSIGDAVLTTDLAGNVTYLNLEAEHLTGWDRQQAIGKPLFEVFNIIDGETRETAPNPATTAMQQNKTVALASGSILIVHDGTEIEIEDSAAPIHNRDKEVTGAVIVFHDVAKSEAMMEKTSRLAWYDHLTGLPNLALFNERLTQSIGMAERHNKRVGLLFLDMDDFKKSNDTFGHLTGDLLLSSVADRITNCIRSTDTVCRRSGDEFLILLGEIEMPDDTKQVSKQILTAIAEPLTINDNEIMLAASIGISIYPDDGTDATKLTECADRAMYHAKKSGKNNFYYSEPHNLSGEVES